MIRVSSFWNSLHIAKAKKNFHICLRVSNNVEVKIFKSARTEDWFKQGLNGKTIANAPRIICYWFRSSGLSVLQQNGMKD